jgi:hypothetical protein
MTWLGNITDAHFYASRTRAPKKIQYSTQQWRTLFHWSLCRHQHSSSDWWWIIPQWLRFAGLSPLFSTWNECPPATQLYLQTCCHSALLISGRNPTLDLFSYNCSTAESLFDSFCSLSQLYISLHSTATTSRTEPISLNLRLCDVVCKPSKWFRTVSQAGSSTCRFCYESVILHSVVLNNHVILLTLSFVHTLTAPKLYCTTSSMQLCQTQVRFEHSMTVLLYLIVGGTI